MPRRQLPILTTQIVEVESIMNRILVVVAIAVIGAASIFAYNNSQKPSLQTSQSTLNTTIISSTSSTSALTITGAGSTVGLTSAPLQCPSGQNASNKSSSGLVLLACFKLDSQIGDSIVFNGILRNDGSASGAYVTESNMTVTDARGNVVFRNLVSPSEPVTLSLGRAYEVTVVWSTGQAYNGILPTAGTYHVYLSIGGVSSETDLTLSG